MASILEANPSDSLDEFVNWDVAAPELGNADSAGDHAATIFFPGQEVTADPLLLSTPDHDREALLFENPDADVFSFMALQHFEQTNTSNAFDPLQPLGSFDSSQPPASSTEAMATATISATLHNDLCPRAPELWDVPGDPCSNCKLGGYQCKTISEGFYKGYCTSCVALRRACSFGLASPGPVPTNESFPPNPWPTLGDHPDPIPALDPSSDVMFARGGPALLSSLPGSFGAPVMSGTGLPVTTRQNDSNTADHPAAAAPPQPKLGTRFSRESVRILKNWIVTHSRHPYPTDEENESLQRLTGLNKTQISNWLANARRRGKIPTTRSTSPHVRNSYASVGPLEISQPRRSATPSPFDRRLQQMDNLLLQRWANSPPENEPASVTDIARAITTSGVSSGLESPSSFNFTDDGSGRSLFNDSSASSLGTSQSSGTGSFASAFSHGSRGSFGSAFSSLGGRGRRRRRRHSALPPGKSGDSSKAGGEKQGNTSGVLPSRKSGPTPLVAPLRTYQCTFCTETFKTKHDWQRHEKSLHLSLERWVCAPQGPVSVHPETKQPSCVFCGHANPDAMHIESHNFGACHERSLSDRTFYRKDHLRQHLRLVHGSKFACWAMDPWKMATAEIRSRCGFCGIVMDTWGFRIDHLADHFKTGRTMADWKGDWGFDEPVLKLVENSIPPFLIHHERGTPLPFSAASKPSSSPRNAYELLRGELLFWLQIQQHDMVQELATRFEACRIVFAADVSSSSGQTSPSWLRDLVLADSVCAQQARLSPIRNQHESFSGAMDIIGKTSTFDACPMEAALQDYARERALAGSIATDAELQAEACRIILKMEEDARNADNYHKGDDTGSETPVADFLIRLASQSTSWLAGFCRRAQMPRLEAIDMDAASHWPVNDPASVSASDPASTDSSSVSKSSRRFIKPSPFFLNDTNCYRRLAHELTRWVAATTSPNNPNAHVPSDEEIQNQARWILYDDDDPWNQTAAENAEWLMRFKRDVGILPSDDGPGLPVHNVAWNITQGGMGFAPPYCYTLKPIAPLACPFEADGMGHDNAVDGGSGGSSDGSCGPSSGQSSDPVAGNACMKGTNGVAPAAANLYLQSFTTRYSKPARVFCSREVEAGLTDFVRAAVVERGEPFPTDAALRAKGREILGCSPPRGTSVDSDDLLGKFKDLVRSELAQEQEKQQQQQQQQHHQQDSDVHNLGLDLSLDALTQEDMDNLMQDIFDF